MEAEKIKEQQKAAAAQSPTVAHSLSALPGADYRPITNPFIEVQTMQNNQQKVKTFELRKQDESTLVQNLNKFRSELVGLRTSKVSSAP